MKNIEKEFLFCRKNSPVGELVIVTSENKLELLIFEQFWQEYRKKFRGIKEGACGYGENVCSQIDEYFAGERFSFDLDLNLTGTNFQKKVWSSLLKIPYGEIISYKDQALLIDNPKAVRAVGRANGMNPICIVLPCHRVVGSNGELTGYAGGIKHKKFLLEMESLSAGI